MYIILNKLEEVYQRLHKVLLQEEKLSFKTKSLGDIENILPGFRKIWPKIKEACGTTQRCPKSVTITTDVSPLYLNDGEIAKRFALNLETMQLSLPRHVSSGEWAVHAGSNNDQGIGSIPSNMAVLTCIYHDYYKYFSMILQVNKIPDKLLAQGY